MSFRITAEDKFSTRQNNDTRNTTIIEHESTELRTNIEKMEIHRRCPQKKTQQLFEALPFPRHLKADEREIYPKQH